MTTKNRLWFKTLSGAVLVAIIASSVIGPMHAQESIYSTRFSQGLDPRLMVQGPTGDSIAVVSASGRNVLKVSINKDDDYSHVANGVPRGEIGFGSVCRFSRGKEYLIRWSTFIPNDFEFDPQQPEGITQIHGGPAKGSPPFGLLLNGESYAVRLEGKPGNTNVGDASADKGKWVQWSLRYTPDDSGAGAITELYKDNHIVFNANGAVNALANDDGAYLKVGVYKWWWQSRPSAVSQRTMYFGDVTISQR